MCFKQRLELPKIDVVFKTKKNYFRKSIPTYTCSPD